MAINFPNSPTNGQKFVDANGTPWVYETSTNSWTAGSVATGGMIYKGGLDITAVPPAGVVAGWTYVVQTGGTANAGFTGLTGNIPQGSQIIFDGAQWQQLSGVSAPASETIRGIVELATAAETTTGTDATRAVHPAGLKVELDKKANLASPALTGTPTAPTAAAGTNTTQVATTAFVEAAKPPQATASTAGIDVKLWKKTGTTLSPATAGDDISTTGAGGFGSLTGRVSVPGVGQIGEVVSTNLTVNNQLFTQNVPQVFTFSTPLNLTPGVWRIEAECRFDSTNGAAGNPTSASYMQYDLSSLTRTGTEVGVVGLPSVAYVNAWTTPGNTKTSTTVALIATYTTNAAVTQATVVAQGWQNGGAPYATFFQSVYLRAIATRIA